MRWHGRRVTIVAPWWSTASRCMRCSDATDLDWSSRTAGRTRNGNTRTSPINGRSHVQKSARSLVSSTRSNVSCRGHFQAMPRHRGCVSNCERSDRVRSSFASGNGPRSKSGLPRSDFGKAVRYMLKRWAGLTRFVEDPRIPLDNNAAERRSAAPSSAARITMGRARSVEPKSPPPSTRSAKPPAWSASIRVHIFCVPSTRQSADLGRLRSLKTCSRQP